MASMHSAASGGDRATTPRTIEEIEARAAAILAEEQQALAALVSCMREIAVRLPADSRLPLDLAAAAKTLETWTTSDMPALGVKVAICGDNRHGNLSRAIDSYLPRAGERDS